MILQMREKSTCLLISKLFLIEQVSYLLEIKGTIPTRTQDRSVKSTLFCFPISSKVVSHIRRYLNILSGAKSYINKLLL